MKIIFATGNMGKMREIRDIMQDMDVEIASMKEAGVYADVVEDGSTFTENAFIKARAIAKVAKEKGIEAIVISDDSGLVVDALNGEPGIKSIKIKSTSKFTKRVAIETSNLFVKYFFMPILLC